MMVYILDDRHLEVVLEQSAYDYTTRICPLMPSAL
jgi:hypothetical protein